jgi:hypothetical protein
MENQIINYDKNLAIQFGGWLMTNAIPQGDGLCWWFDNQPFNNHELFELWLKTFMIK